MVGSNSTTPTIPAGAGDPAPYPDPALSLQAALSRPPQPPRLARLVWRATTSFSFTVAISIVSLTMLAVSCAISEGSLVVAVAKFAIASTMYWWMYPSSGFVVALSWS